MRGLRRRHLLSGILVAISLVAITLGLALGQWQDVWTNATFL